MTIIAIDFGTSNSVVAMLSEADTGDRSLIPMTIHLEEVSQAFATPQGLVWLVPSCVYIRGREDWLIGKQVQELGDIHQPERFFQGFKRDLVANFQPPARELDQVSYDAEAIAAIFLSELWHRLQQQNIVPTHIIFTVPVGAFEAYRHWLQHFTEQHHLPSYQIVDESTAAALGYAITRPNTLVLVIDFGGGTLDLSLVRTAPINQHSLTYQAEAIAKSDAYIGGIDIDHWIGMHFLAKLGILRSQITDTVWLQLLKESERLKIQLSLTNIAQGTWRDHQNQEHPLQLEQMELLDILERHHLLDQLREAIDEIMIMVLNRGISRAAIEQVLLVGGSCQIVAVQQLVVSYFGKSKVQMGKPFEAVAHGSLSIAQSISINDHLRHSYAIRLWEPYLQQYSFYPIFTKGTSYPCHSAEPLVLQAAIANQAEIWLDIGEVADTAQAEISYDASGRMMSSQLVKKSDFRSLNIKSSKSSLQEPPQVCIARLTPLGQAGSDRIAIMFEVDERRVLIATVRDLLTQSVLIDRQAIAKLE
ncbi:MAG: Hsp70 family protein [Pseudanabaenaceae cyanobacterium bins.39]|nr:Hsp70 family protein [Pseudanabaenaceae cyanobacterium bins.39]